jgi:ABC-type Na+ efflux pump permease subunit
VTPVFAAVIIAALLFLEVLKILVEAGVTRIPEAAKLSSPVGDFLDRRGPR